MLQGSILSPFLYSIFINSLPAHLRTPPPKEVPSPEVHLSHFLNRLIYADDVAIISTAEKMQRLLSRCEDHSIRYGYCWNPSKCVILDPSGLYDFKLYGTSTPVDDHFLYLGLSFETGGRIDTKRLVKQGISKAMSTMSVLSSVGVHSKVFPWLLSCRIYQLFVRFRIGFGLAIAMLTGSDISVLEKTYDRLRIELHKVDVKVYRQTIISSLKRIEYGSYFAAQSQHW